MDQPTSRPARLSLEQLGALAIGADADRMSLAHLYLNPRGRIPRRTFWLHGVLGLLLMAVTGNALLDIAGVESDTSTKLVNLVFAWPVIALSAKRQHDFNFSAWWAAINLVPGIGSLVMLLVDGTVPGTHGTNRFGPDPREAIRRRHVNTVH